jgi:Zn-dependent alcohol dehydrogenase
VWLQMNLRFRTFMPRQFRVMCVCSCEYAQELELEGLVTHEVSLKDINKAFDLLLRGESLRCIIWMDK